MLTSRRYSACLVGIVLLTCGAGAQDHAPPANVPGFAAQGAFIAVVVADLDASERWYESNLGLHLIKRGKSPRIPAETVVLGGNNLFVELIHHDGKQLPRVDDEAAAPRLIKAGVVVAQKDFDAVAAYLQKRGVEVRSFEDQEMRMRSFLSRDNEGNIIQFFTPQ